MATVPGGEPLCLHVLVVSATGLYKKDLFGLSDPYVRLTLRRKSKSVQTHNTKKKKNTLSPQWSETFIFNNINHAEDSLLLEVFDNKRLTRDNFLGKLHFKLQHMPIEMRKANILQHGNTVTYPLKPRSRKSRVSGNLTLKFLYYNNPPPRASAGINNLAQLVPGATGPNSPPSSNGGIARQPSSDSWVMVDNDNDESEPLPEGWEERQDANGRVFYVDHINRRTQWERPTRANVQSAGQVRAQMESVRRRQLAQTLARRNPGMSTAESVLDLTQTPPRSQESSPIGTRSASTNAVNAPLATPPPLPPRSTSTSVIPRPRPSSNNSLSPATTPLRPSTPSGLSSVTSAPSEEEELPAGWERRQTAAGRVFYIDHNTRKTQWIPPVRPGRPQSMISLGSSNNGSPRTSSTNSSQPQPEGGELGPLPANWEVRILGDGRKFFIDHNTKSTQWEDPRLIQKQKQAAAVMPYSRDYKLKIENLRKQLAAKKPSDLPRVFEIPVKRTNLFEDSYRAVMACKNKDHFKTRLWVKFDGEKGLDYGGVSREWFFLLSHEMFNPYYGLFEYSAGDNYTLQVNPDSGFCNEHHLEYFRFIGRIMGMAVYHQRLLDAFFIRPFYKMLLSKRITLSDMEYVDTEFYNSVKYILENDPEPLCLTFSASREFVGQVEEVDLKPGGADIDVTESNKKEYVALLMKWRFEDRICKQMDAIKKGFNDIFHLKMLQVFDEREMEYLLCGLAEINVGDWRKHTVYAAGYVPTDNVIVWFWKAVENFDNEMRARLLQFVTGTSKVPMNGFAELQGSNGPQKFCIKKLGEPTSLPRAHTCFNRIDLPPYRSYHELKEKLRLAVENTEGFEGVD